MSRHETFSVERTRELVAAHAGVEGPLLPILHSVQYAFGHVPEAAVPVIAEELNLTRAEVYGSSPSITTSAMRRPAGTW